MEVELAHSPSPLERPETRDVVTTVFTFLLPKAQAALRSCSSTLSSRFDHAAYLEVELGCCGTLREVHREGDTTNAASVRRVIRLREEGDAIPRYFPISFLALQHNIQLQPKLAQHKYSFPGRVKPDEEEMKEDGTFPSAEKPAETSPGGTSPTNAQESAAHTPSSSSPPPQENQTTGGSKSPSPESTTGPKTPLQPIESIVEIVADYDRIHQAKTDYVQTPCCLVVKGHAKSMGDGWFERGTGLGAVGCYFPGVKKVGDGWLFDCPNLMGLRLEAMVELTSVGSRWLAKSGSGHLQLGDLPSLTTVGDSWLLRAPNLTHFTTHRLPALKTVGPFWLSNCPLLKAVEFGGLPLLETVGAGWLSECRSLTQVGISGLPNLRQVLGGWLAQCSNLVVVRFTNLPALRKIHENWLQGCTLLQVVGLESLPELRTIGSGWLSNCSSLVTLVVKNLPRLEGIGHSWLKQCSSLTSVELVRVPAFTALDLRWLATCPMLTTLALHHLPSLAKVVCAPMTSPDPVTFSELVLDPGLPNEIKLALWERYKLPRDGGGGK